MKINYSSKSGQSGTALLVALFLCLILSVSIAGYLKHSSQQNFLSMRAQAWNLTMAVSEAGVEEGMAHLNASPEDLSADGWAKNGTAYTVSRSLNPTTRYTVTIDAVNPQKPAITSQAFIDAPTGASASPLLAAIGVTVAPVQEATISRAVRVSAGRSGMFLKAMVAKHTIDMNGQKVMTDSFNSSDSRYSDQGMYPTNVAKRLDNGDVASNDSIVDAVMFGNANVFGHVAVGPKGNITINNGKVGSRAWQVVNPVGTIEPGYFSDDMNFTFPTIGLPYTVGLSPKKNLTISETNYTFTSVSSNVTSSIYPSPVPVSGVQSNITYLTVTTLPNPVPFGTITNILTIPTNTSTYPAAGTYVGTVEKKNGKWNYDAITGYNYRYPSYTYTYNLATVGTNFTVNATTYDYVFDGGAANMAPQQFYIDEIANGKVLIRGNVQLVVRNNYKQSGGDVLLIAPNGCLEMWVGGTAVNLTGLGVMNNNGYAQNFILWCADSVTDLKMAGNGEFTGIIVAPNADTTLNGGGSGDEDFIGSIIANTIKLNGHYNFHYDEALQNFRNKGRYIVTQWNEITVANVGN